MAGIYKAYGIRGIYPEEVNTEIVRKVGQTCHILFNPGKVIVAHDGRHGSVELAEAAKEGIQNGKKKFEILFVGLATTPMFYFLVNHFKASGGLMITASHNPKNDNGVKVVKEEAVMIQGFEIEKAVAELN